MKKRVLAILLIVILAFGLVSCNLFETNTEKDLARVVATVRHGSYSDNITKRQLLNAINSQAGYMQSTSLKDLTEQVLQQLTRNRIAVQEAAIFVTREVLKRSANVSYEVSGVNPYASAAAGLRELFGQYYEDKNVSVPAEYADDDILHVILGRDDAADDSEVDIAESRVISALKLLTQHHEQEDVKAQFAFFNESVNAINTSLIQQVEILENEYITSLRIEVEEDEEEEEEDVTDKTPRTTRTKTAAEVEPVKITMPLDNDGEEIEIVEELLEKPWLIPRYYEHKSRDEKVGKGENPPSYHLARREALSRLDNLLSKQKYTYESFYEEQLIAYLESYLVSKYQEFLDDEASLTYARVLQAHYEQWLNQKQTYSLDMAAYVTARNSVTDTSYILYNPAEGYGYVKHILIQFDDVSAALFAGHQNSGIPSEALTELRNQIAERIVTKDLREYQKKGEITYYYDDGGEEVSDTLAYKKYDVISETLHKLVEIHNEKTITKLEFKYNDSEDEEQDYTVDVSGNIYTAIEKVFFKQTGDALREDFNPADPDSDLPADNARYYLYYGLGGGSEFDIEQTAEQIFTAFKNAFGENATTNADIFKTDFNAANLAERNELEDLLAEWIFRYNQDPGIFNNAAGYLITPKGDLGSQETYMKEFADGARAVYEQGVGSYTMILTDYGYHIIVCTDVVEPQDPVSQDDELPAYFHSIVNKLLDGEELTDIEKTSDIYKLYTELLNSEISDIYNNTIGKAFAEFEKEDGGEDRVKSIEYFESRYKEFLVE